MKEKNTYIKTFVFKNEPNNKNFTQTGSTLTLMPSKNGVDNKRMKVLRVGLQMEVALESLQLYTT